MKRLSLFSFLLILFAVVLTSSCAKEVETNNVASQEVENRNFCECNQLLEITPLIWHLQGGVCTFRFKTEPNASVKIITGCPGASSPSNPGGVPTVYGAISDINGLVAVDFSSIGFTEINIKVNGGNCGTFNIQPPCLI